MTIVKFNPPGDREVKVENRYLLCSHRRGVTVDAEARTVNCSQCGDAINAVDFLVQWSEDNERHKGYEKASKSFYELAVALSKDFQVNTQIRRGGVTFSWEENGKRKKREINGFYTTEWAVQMMAQIRHEFSWRLRDRDSDTPAK